MAFDGIVTTAVVHDLQNRIVGGRIERIPNPKDIDTYINDHYVEEKVKEE